jgi:Flp pilus assembly protein TadG
MLSILRSPRTALRRHLRTRTRGQSLVEFALILPLFLIFVAACLDLGRVFYANISLNNAAREGAMQAAQTPTSYVQNGACDPVSNKVVCRVQLESKGSSVQIASTDISLACAVPTCPKAVGSFVTVQVRGTFRLVTPLLSFVFGGQTIGLTSSATAQIEYLPQIGTVAPPPAPVAEFTATPRTGIGDPTITVSFDPDLSTGSPDGFQWDFTGDGTVDSTDQYPTHDYGPGTYKVTLTVINLTNVDTEVKDAYIVIDTPGGPPPPPPPSAAPSTTPCTYPPNVIGSHPGTASADIINAGFAVTSFGDLTNGQKNKIQAQNPDHTQCLAPGTMITIHYRSN